MSLCAPDRTATVDLFESWKQPTTQKGSVVGQQIQSPDQAIAGSAPRPICVRAMPEEQWLRTPQAAIACGVSERTLKRLRDEVLEEGVHYQPGFSTNAAITWEIYGVREKLA